MIENRQNASCAVFEGKIVVTGGSFSVNSFSHRDLNSAESYCFYENKWTKFPNMLVARNCHTTVSMGNKLFVIGNDYKKGSEVFDSVTNKFVYIKSPLKINHFNAITILPNVNALSIGYKILLFQDVDRNEINVSEFFENGKKEEKSEMLIYCYNDKQNAWIQENELQIDCKVASCVNMSKK